MVNPSQTFLFPVVFSAERIGVLGVDKLYAFPPPTILDKVLRKLALPQCQ